jgi:hypothetical protein
MGTERQVTAIAVADEIVPVPLEGQRRSDLLIKSGCHLVAIRGNLSGFLATLGDRSHANRRRRRPPATSVNR